MLTPVTFEDFSGGQADLYIGTDVTRQETIQNFLIDETKRPYVRYGTNIYSTRIPGTYIPSGLYMGPEPFSHPVVISGPSAYVANEISTFTEITGVNTTFLPTKGNERDSSIVWRRQLVSVAPVTGLPPALIYSTVFSTPSAPATPAVYKALTIGMPALASSPNAVYKFTVSSANATAVATYTNNGKTFTVIQTISSGTTLYATGTGDPGASGTLTKGSGTGDATITFSAFVIPDSLPSGTAAYNVLYAFFYKATYVDYKGTLFEFIGNPNNPAFVVGASSADPGTANINIVNIPALANTALTNYDTTAAITTNTTYTRNSITATVADATGLYQGQQLINANVSPGTCIISISGTTLTLSARAISTASASSTVFSAITVQIYRTINGGTVFFYDGMIANGVTTFVDNISDSNLQLNQAIYTSGGALGYDQPPTNAIAVTQTNDFFWYATTTALYQSVQGAPGGCPSSFSDEIDQKIVGLSDVISFPILFCDKSVYRVEGTFDSFGNGGYVLREIHKTAGCFSNSSIVKTPYGLIWFGTGGIYVTDGYNVREVTRHLNISYGNWAGYKVTGEYEPNKNMVYWTINSLYNPNGNNDAFLILHLSYPLDEQSVFTWLDSENNIYPSAMKFSLSADILNADPIVRTTGTWATGASSITVSSATGLSLGMSVSGIGIGYDNTITSISGTTIGLRLNTSEAQTSANVVFSRNTYSQMYSRMAFTDINGYLLWFDPNCLADVLIDTTLYPSQMVKKTIMYDFTTSGLDQGTAGFRKYTSDVILEVDASTPVAIQIQHRRDDGGGGWSGQGGTPPTGKGVAGSPGGGSTGNPGVPEIRQDGAISWEVTDCLWSTDADEHLWNDFATVSGKRTVPAGQLRASRRQLKFTNAYTIIAGSDTYGTCTISGAGTTAPKATLDTVGQIWISDPEGYYLTFEGDGYNQTFFIKYRISDTVLQLVDPYSLLVNGSAQWEMKGYRKFERPRIVSFTLNAEVDGSTFGQATASQGANT